MKRFYSNDWLVVDANGKLTDVGQAHYVMKRQAKLVRDALNAPLIERYIKKHGADEYAALVEAGLSSDMGFYTVTMGPDHPLKVFER